MHAVVAMEYLVFVGFLSHLADRKKKTIQPLCHCVGCQHLSQYKLHTLTSRNTLARACKPFLGWYILHEYSNKAIKFTPYH